MSKFRFFALSLALASLGWLRAADADDDAALLERARRLHETSILFDGHNDLPWRLRKDGDLRFEKFDLSKRLTTGQTDIPRLREGGLKAQFWSVYIPSEHPHPARTVIEQIDLVKRMAERYPDDFAIAYTADDVEHAVRAGKIASLIGIEGGVAIEHNLALLRAFYSLGARYMTLTHATTLDWADSATDAPRHGGLTEFGERVVREMNRLGMLVDISHVSPDTMKDALRVSVAPVIASHSSAFATARHPRNVPDDVLKLVARNGGVVMVNFYSGFIVSEYAERSSAERARLRAAHPHDPAAVEKGYEDWLKAHPMPRGTIGDVANHIDHIIKVAGIDHVGIGSDFDGITSWPEGLDDVSCYPKLTAELLRRGRSDDEVRRILGGNVLRVLRDAERTSARLRATMRPEVDQPLPEK